MSRTIKPILKGEPITADFLEAVRREVVKTIRVAAPLQLTENAAGTFISWVGETGTALRLAYATEDIAKNAKGMIEVYKGTPSEPVAGEQVEAYNRWHKAETGQVGYAFKIGGEWEFFFFPDADEDESIPLKSGYTCLVGGVPDTGTVTFAVEIEETDGPSGYHEFTQDITGDSAGSFIDAIHSGLGLSDDEKEKVVLLNTKAAKLKFTSFGVVSSFASFKLDIIAADLTVASGGWPVYSRCFRSLVADVVDEEGDGT